MIRNNIIEEKKLMLKICVAGEGSIEKGLLAAECIYDMLDLNKTALLLNTFQSRNKSGRRPKAYRNFMQVLDARLGQYMDDKKKIN